MTGPGPLGGGQKSSPMGSSLIGTPAIQPTLLSIPKLGMDTFSAASAGHSAAAAHANAPAPHFSMFLRILTLDEILAISAPPSYWQNDSIGEPSAEGPL